MKYIIVRAVKWETTYFTDPEAPYGSPKAVSKEEAEVALKKAQSQYPNQHYKLKEVKNV